MEEAVVCAEWVKNKETGFLMDRKSELLVLQPGHEQSIRQAGQLSFPRECCGFILGEVRAGLRNVVLLIPTYNDREASAQSNRFAIDPMEFLKAERTAQREKLMLLGFYHSHPNGSARPSAFDLEHAWPWYSYVIVSVRDGIAEQITSWTLNKDGSQFTQEYVEITDQGRSL